MDKSFKIHVFHMFAVFMIILIMNIIAVTFGDATLAEAIRVQLACLGTFVMLITVQSFEKAKP